MKQVVVQIDAWYAVSYMKYERNTSNMFKGTVDQFMEHCANLDADAIEAQVNADTRKQSIEFIMREAECTVEEAEEIYQEICLQEVKDAVQSLMKDGLVEIVGYDENGEALYAPTNKAKKLKNNS